jgi:hypothetical protein
MDKYTFTNNCFYFDTSAINRIHEDLDADSLVAKIKTYSRIYISIFTLAELMAHPDRGERAQLLRLTKDISSGYRPLAMPNELLKRSLEVLLSGANKMDASMGSEWNGVWIAFSDPSLIDGDAYFEVVNWKKQQEEWYQEMHDAGRPYIQDALLKLPAKARLSIISRPSEILRYFVNQPEYLPDLVYEMAIRCGYKSFTRNLTNQVLQLEPWRFFLGGLAYGFYIRSVQKEDFSKKFNPGSIDTQQAIYLAGCNTFVTCDVGQHRMMRWLVPLGHQKRRIWHYDQFRKWVLNLP